MSRGGWWGLFTFAVVVVTKGLKRSNVQKPIKQFGKFGFANETHLEHERVHLLPYFCVAKDGSALRGLDEKVEECEAFLFTEQNVVFVYLQASSAL